jgi:tetratricopeptide (TPR) repeat protein
LEDNAARGPAEVFLREAQRRHPNDFWLNHNLFKFVRALQPPHWDEAVRFAAVAVALRPDSPGAHGNLGNALYYKGRLDEAIAEWREANRLDKNIPEAHYNLGLALEDYKGQLDEAVLEYREAIRIKKDKADAHCNLGRVLQRKGQFAEALGYLRRGHELGSQDPRWRYPSAQWVKECERLLELDRKLPAILSGRQGPADVGERIALAQLCHLPCKKYYVAAFRFYQQAFATEPKLTGDQPSIPRYNAACAAALAGCRQGKDAADLGEEECAHFRCQALEWLRADLAAWGRLLEKEPEKARPVIVRQMREWLGGADFAGVRGPAALAKLPAAERPMWQQLWADVADTLARAEGKTVPAKRPDSK